MRASYIIISIIILALATISISAKAQDILASQAPTDKKKNLIDSLKIEKIIQAEIEEFSSLGIYLSWDNERAHTMDPNIVIPERFKIDLTGFAMPTKNTKITSRFGPRGRRQHKGLDIKVQVGDTIYAAFSGKVRVVKDQGRRKGYGKYVIIRHSNGLETVYGHLSEQLVSPNQKVVAGEPIGLGGNTGRSSGSHLHFETRFLGVAINPEHIFNFPNQDIAANTYTFVRGSKQHFVERKSGNYSSRINSIHRVKKGETISQIAKKYGISVSKLCQMNKIKAGSKLRVGQILRYA